MYILEEIQLLLALNFSLKSPFHFRKFTLNFLRKISRQEANQPFEFIGR